MTTAARGERPQKEALFVQVKTPDDHLVFFDETQQLGRKMPYDRPEATCAMRASKSTVSFCLLKLSNRTRTLEVEKRLELPRGPLDRTERRAEALGKDLPAGTIQVEIEDVTYPLNISRDENGVASLESPEGVDDVIFDLPRGRLRLTIVLASPRGSKIVAASFQGHLGKPEAKETVVRVAAMALNHLAGLSAFRLVSGIETVNVPASPARFVAARQVRRAADQVIVSVPVRLWSDDPAPVPVGEMVLGIQVDLETANPISGRLLFHMKPTDEFAEVFETYRGVAAEAALSLVTTNLGPDDVTDLVYSIALGEVGEGDLERLREATATITGLDLTPKQWVVFAPSV